MRRKYVRNEKKSKKWDKEEKMWEMKKKWDIEEKMWEIKEKRRMYKKKTINWLDWDLKHMNANILWTHTQKKREKQISEKISRKEIKAAIHYKKKEISQRKAQRKK